MRNIYCNLNDTVNIHREPYTTLTCNERVSCCSLRTPADGFVALDEALGSLSAVARIAAQTVDAGLAGGTLVIWNEISGIELLSMN